MGSQIALDAGLTFDAKKALHDAVVLGQLAPRIGDSGIRRAAQGIARNLPRELTTDDSDDLIAGRLAELVKACQAWQK